MILPGHRKEESKANELEEMWKRSERRHRERLKRENRAAWYSFHMHLADNHTALAAEHRDKAASLLGEGEGVDS